MADQDIEMRESRGDAALNGTSTPPPGEEGEPKTEKPDPPLASQFREAIMGSKINGLYLFIPIAIIANYSQWSPSVIFVFAFLALIPLAAALGDFTEDISLRTNDATAALINVTFGNATELIISIMALRLGDYDLIKMSLIGSVLGNMLLVMGTSLLLAGMKRPTLKFNPAATNTYMATIVLSSFSFIIPTAHSTLDSVQSDGPRALRTSRQMSVLMISIYVGYLYFQQKTHKELFDGVTVEEPSSPVSDVAMPAGTSGEDEQQPSDNEEEENEEAKYGFWFCFIAIGIVAVLISWLSDFLVGSVEGAAKGLYLSKHFISLILIPIVGNVAEHASAVMLAVKGKMDIAVGVAFGSAVQIGMFVLPLLVVIAWIFDRPLDMIFSVFTVSSLFASVVLTFTITSSGQSTWLGGAKMTAAYLMLAVAYLNSP